MWCHPHACEGEINSIHVTADRVRVLGLAHLTSWSTEEQCSLWGVCGRTRVLRRQSAGLCLLDEAKHVRQLPKEIPVDVRAFNQKATSGSSTAD